VRRAGQPVRLRQQFCKSFSLSLAQQRLRKQLFYTFKQPVHTKAASSTPSSVNSAIARNQEASAPAVAAASQQAQQNSKQPHEGMSSSAPAATFFPAVIVCARPVCMLLHGSCCI